MTTSAGLRESRRVAQRDAMLAAATELARSGGYDAVQMREIADLVGMSPGSVYNYFESKDHLLSTLMVDWTQTLLAEIAARPPRHASTVDRVVTIFSLALDGLTEEARLAEALLVAVRQYVRTSDDRAPKESVQGLLAGAVRAGFRPEFPEADREEILGILTHVWYALLIGWAAGWYTPEEARSEIRTAATRLIVPVETGRS